MPQQDSILIGIIVFGLVHGLNPSHGWIIATMYSIQSKRMLLSSITSAGIIAGAHFLSSIVVIIAYIFVEAFFMMSIPQQYLQYFAAASLGILAYFFWRERGEDLVETQHGHLHPSSSAEQTEHEHTHWHAGEGNHTHLHIHRKRSSPKLWAIAGSALALGFAHEEEFVILSLAVGGADPLSLIVAYASAVAASLVAITMLSVKVYAHIQHKMIYYSKYLPKISALILAVMAVGFALQLF
jgi:nickel/cobalt transporter (NicO) family protein